MSENQMEVKVSVEEFARKLGLEIVYQGRDEMTLTTFNVSRPGLQLAGFFDYFGDNRVQVMGNAEMEYYSVKPEEDKVMIMEMILSKRVPCMIVSRNLEISKTLLSSFVKNKCPLFRSSLETSQLVNNLIMYLNELLAQSMTMHGVLIDVSGVGVLLTGRSGIGKSETALELVKRGHRLIADDAVIVKRIQNELVGESPIFIKNFMEIRGIGILDVRSIYGIGAVSDKKSIDLVVEMENWSQEKAYDRLEGNSNSENILGINIPKIVLPITPGRNLPIIIEAAATNHMLKLSGYDAAQALIKKTLGK